MKRLQIQENRVESVLPNVPVRVALLALRFYKTYLSFLFAGNCRFDPTCSQYAYQAIERFGVFGGVWLGLKRLLRCHPLSHKFGFDPVPESWKSNSLPPQDTAHKLVISQGEPGLRESPATSLPSASAKGHQSLRAIHSRNFEIHDEVHP